MAHHPDGVKKDKKIKAVFPMMKVGSVLADG
jgi:hypothetical protein